jgi:MtfA peptidase
MNPERRWNTGVRGSWYINMTPIWPFRITNKPGQADLPATLATILETHVTVYKALPDDLATRLRGRVADFLNEVRMEGCGGLELTDQMRVIIAGYACLLRLGHDEGTYPDLSSILVYPDDFLAPVGSDNELGVVSDEMEWRAGESWPLGAVVLSWKEIARDMRSLRRGARHLVLHEFAHQLDTSFRLSDGVDPDTGEALLDGVWHRVLARAYRGLAGLPEPGRGRRSGRKIRVDRSVLDSYGAEHPAELFSVATESFFLEAEELRRSDPELFEQLLDFYRIDPTNWILHQPE